MPKSLDEILKKRQIESSKNEIKFFDFIDGAKKKNILKVTNVDCNVEVPGTLYGKSKRKIDTKNENEKNDAYFALYNYLVKKNVITKKNDKSTFFTWDSVHKVNQDIIQDENNNESNNIIDQTELNINLINNLDNTELNNNIINDAESNNIIINHTESNYTIINDVENRESNNIIHDDQLENILYNNNQKNKLNNTLTYNSSKDTYKNNQNKQNKNKNNNIKSTTSKDKLLIIINKLNYKIRK
jgi:hypothetical protein